MPLDIAKKTQWETNHENIVEYYLEYLTKNNKAPSAAYLAEKTNLTKKTVYAHIERLLPTEVANKYRLRIGTIMESLCKRAESGDPTAIKLFFQLVGFNEKQVVEHNHRQVKIVFTNPNKKDLDSISERIETEDTNYEVIENNE